jgi:membrane protease subunit (stomatin/prohibitin family)
MSLLDKIRGKFIDIIEWTEPSQSDILAYRFPRYDNAIKMGARLTVREGQAAAFVNEGQLADRLRAGHVHLADAEPAHPVHAQGLEVRLPLPLQGRGLLHLHPAVD